MQLIIINLDFMPNLLQLYKENTTVIAFIY
jgi:hypothetical protein